MRYALAGGALVIAGAGVCWLLSQLDQSAGKQARAERLARMRDGLA
jgi:hypothetical protein